MEEKKLDETVKEKVEVWVKESSKKLDELFVDNKASNLFDLSLLAIEEMERLRFYKSLAKDTFEQAKKRSFIVAREDLKYWYFDSNYNRLPKLSVEVKNMIEKVAEASRLDVALRTHTWLKSIESGTAKQADMFDMLDEKIKFEPYLQIKENIKNNF
ncbi:hypothetical protein [Flavobacterium soli]|uniref:hypothetical protein n=1 Tax=Flavobacterium soli TaxID=344881 RepID=UPI00042263B0|nr:hypothetical protein [Flavobacterium soli]